MDQAVGQVDIAALRIIERLTETGSQVTSGLAQSLEQMDTAASSIIDRFSSHKVLTLMFANGTLPSDFARYGELIELAEPRVKLRVDRQQISQVLASVLANHTLEDVSVEDQPLEEVIAKVFAQSAETAAK